ncbi:hypothetical protein STCU_03950 [Strigomonas culicis]|uniref:Thioredoxin domain-containing protein n=1 Tax=Strigomonas culicis TaxID=28005 RepID=S9VDL7_9TRYP|nr:hypothetical protein STCU_06847 [Strigomonas culicis]EPY30673.1 hypothetical protein STCU_03950 [Strigomonas culicis]|eukprot:EPY25091.1 hypothetical protein STCU_06847 [Strigomonas culicis]
MSDDEGSEKVQAPQPQQFIPFLFNVDDFTTQVLNDECNLCCIVVTSTMCPVSGIHKLKYPKVKASTREGGDDKDEEEEEEAEEEDEEENDTARRQDSFFNKMKTTIVENKETLFQRRHVRFFHVCHCEKGEVNIAPLIAADPTLTLTGRQPNAQETAAFHEKAHTQLLELLRTFNVYSTPTLLFYVKGEPLRYSSCKNTTNDALRQIVSTVDAKGDRDVLRAGGINLPKWEDALNNAVVLRNDLMREYDAAVKQKLKEERKEARRLARLARRQQKKDEEAEEEEEEEDN